MRSSSALLSPSTESAIDHRVGATVGSGLEYQPYGGESRRDSRFSLTHVEVARRRSSRQR